jgi:hypothetical protein
MFKTMASKILIDTIGKVIIAGSTVLVAKGYVDEKTAMSIASHSTELLALVVGIVLTTSVKVLDKQK